MIRNVVVAGGGVLGSQIAFQNAYKGFETTIWLRSEASIGRCKPKIEQWRQAYLQELEAAKSMLGNPRAPYARGLIDDFETMTPEKLDEIKGRVNEAAGRIRYELDLAQAVKDADLLIESVAEIVADKEAFYKKLAPLLPERCILATNSSTFMPSHFAAMTGRPEKYLALHFANHIWRNNPAEIMGHPKTNPAVCDAIAVYAKALGMVPLRLQKEQPGYLINSLLVPFLNAALALLAKEVSTPVDIDLAWKLATGAPLGPFQIFDVVGLETAYNILSAMPGAQDPSTLQGKMVAILKSYIDKGKKGRNAGEGFYAYR